MNHRDCKKMIKKLAKLELKRKKKNMARLFPARLEPATFRVLGGRDNHYTRETTLDEWLLRFTKQFHQCLHAQCLDPAIVALPY